MSHSSNRSSSPNRFGIGFFSILQLSLIIFSIFFVNYLSSKNYIRWDFSRSADYSLSNSTLNYLDSAAVRERKKPIQWIMAYRRSDPFYTRIRALAEEYERRSGNQISLEVIDPLRNPERATQFTTKYQLSLVSDLILIDARPDENIPVVLESEQGSKILNSNITIAVGEEMLKYTVDHQQQRRPSEFLGESLLTARLVEAVEGKPKTFLFLADKSRVEGDQKDHSWNRLAEVLRFRNIVLKPVNVMGLERIPSEIDGLAIISPKYDFTEEEIRVLEAYWNQPRSSLLIMLDAEYCPPALRTFLRSKGVTPRKNRIISMENGRLITSAKGHFVQGIPFLKDLAGQSSTFEGASSSLEVRENAEDLNMKMISPTPLFQVANTYWGETDFERNLKGERVGREFDPTRDVSSPLYIAASITRGSTNQEEYASEVSRLIVTSNTDFLDPQRQRAENIDFLSSSINWLVKREALTGSIARTIGTYKLPLLDIQVTFLNRMNLIYMPVAFALVGLMVYSSRRS